MIDEKIPLTTEHLNKIRAKYPACKNASDELLIDCLIAYDKAVENGVTVLFSICFPTFNEYFISHSKSKP